MELSQKIVEVLCELRKIDERMELLQKQKTNLRIKLNEELSKEIELICLAKHADINEILRLETHRTNGFGPIQP